MHSKLTHTFNTQDQSTIIDDFLKISGCNKLLSKIYIFLNNSDTSISLPASKWEQDLSITPDADFWTQICKNNFNYCKIPNLQLIQFKVNHRTHYTGERLNKMGFITSNKCTQCTQNTIDNYFHDFWHCTLVQQFWVQVTEHLSHIRLPHPSVPQTLPSRWHVSFTT